MQTIRFEASINKNRLVAGMIFVLLAVLMTCTAARYENASWRTWITPVLFWTMIVAGIVFRVRYYMWTDTDLVIQTPLYSLTYPKSEIQSYQLITDPDELFPGFGFSWSNLLGNFGKFYTYNIGWVTWFTTQRKNYVVLETTSKKKIVLSPDDRNGFVAVLQQNPA